eukprot:COSAG06_NODE_2288_length_7155_cov_7.276219_3_plen_197_part_00
MMQAEHRVNHATQGEGESGECRGAASCIQSNMSVRPSADPQAGSHRAPSRSKATLTSSDMACWPLHVVAGPVPSSHHCPWRYRELDQKPGCHMQECFETPRPKDLTQQQTAALHGVATASCRTPQTIRGRPCSAYAGASRRCVRLAHPLGFRLRCQRARLPRTNRRTQRVSPTGYQPTSCRRCFLRHVVHPARRLL